MRKPPKKKIDKNPKTKSFHERSLDQRLRLQSENQQRIIIKQGRIVLFQVAILVFQVVMLVIYLNG